MKLLPLALLTAPILALAAACGDDDNSRSTPTGGATATAATLEATSTRAASTPTPTPAPAPEGATVFGGGTHLGGSEAGTVLVAGTYYTETFNPRAVMTIGDGWGNAGQTDQQIILLRKPEPGDIALTLDSAGNETVEVHVSRYTSLPGTEASAVTEATIAGLPVKQFDVTIVDSSVPIPRLDEMYVSHAGDKLRFWILDMNGTTVKIIAEATAEEFDAFVSIAEGVLATLSFE